MLIFKILDQGERFKDGNLKSGLVQSALVLTFDGDVARWRYGLLSKMWSTTAAPAGLKIPSEMQEALPHKLLYTLLALLHTAYTVYTNYAVNP